MSDSALSPQSSPKPRRRWLRRVLLLAVPLLAAVAGFAIYLHGGRYISTDNAYVAAQKVLVTPQISGTVDEIKVSEGQKLKAGDVLFTIDPRPYEIALAEARAALTRAETDFGALKSQYQGYVPQIAVARHMVELRQSEVARKSRLLASKVVARADIEQDEVNLELARASLAALEQGQRNALSQLGGDPDARLDSHGPWLAAKAALDRAQWNLAQTVLKAPLDGIATQVSNIQLGRFLAAGSPVFAIVSDEDVWVEANPKETDITWLRPEQEVSVTVDAFPGVPFKGHVASISPGTGAQFSLIPAQNASGNWVKVVQRVPVRVALDPAQDLSGLRAGMSVTVDIDTHRVRTLAGLLHWEAVAHPVRDAGP